MRSAIVLMIFVAACGKDDGSGGAFVAITDVQAMYRQSYCLHLVRCGEFPDQATCVLANIGAVPFTDSPVSNPQVVAAVLAGTVIYDGNTMQQCFDQLGAATCDTTAQDYRTVPTACFETFRGTVAAGGTCYLDAECVSESCNIASCTNPDGCCPGTCVGDTPPVNEPNAIGQACTGDSDSCVVGAYCNSNGQCAMLQPAGTPCSAGYECDYGLGCAGLASPECKVLPTLGEPCAAQQCRDEGTSCSSSATCVAVGTDGEPCNDTTDCSPFYQCDSVLHLCTEKPHLGQSCLNATCFDANSYCDVTSLFCMPLQDDGSPCTSGSQCASGQCTTTDTVGVCAEPTCI